MPGPRSSLLQRLAGLYGIETSYRDFTGRRQVPAHSILAALKALGAPVASEADVSEAFREYGQKLWQSCFEPVAVSWNGNPVQLELRLQAGRPENQADCRLELENGDVRSWICDLASLPATGSALVEGVKYEGRKLTLPSGLPWGYHRFTLTLSNCRHKALIISSPRQAFTLPAGEGEHIWGVFLPLYALHSENSWGAGDLSDMKALMRWIHGLGGSLVGTLPLLATFLDELYAPSPYTPVSRLFWNEFYLDVRQAKEFEICPGANELLNSSMFHMSVESLRNESLVNYYRVMKEKRKILEHLARCCFSGDSGRLADLQQWTAKNPKVKDYSRFRAVTEKRRASWPSWPERMRNGIIRKEDYTPEAEQYHLYVQWLAHEQFQELSAQARQNGQRFYLDLPLGVHGTGYDVWRERSLFATEASCGAPPDAFFTGGQNWGFPPFNPITIRKQDYRYYIACLRHHLQHAGILRLDHVMGLHRLFWIPRGLEAHEGVYVRYRAGEFYAVLALESQRRQAMIIGEDLGNVPAYVRAAMARHNVCRMYVLPAEYKRDSDKNFNPVPPHALACLNTHDMPPFAAFWQEKKNDAADRAALSVFLYNRGLIETPTNKTGTVFRACLAYLAASRAQVLLINMEDLWLETACQNIPGTNEEYPNWRKKSRYQLEVFSQMPEVLEVLQMVNHLRHSRTISRSYRLFHAQAGTAAPIPLKGKEGKHGQ